jgi:hypothetical protein
LRPLGTEGSATAAGSKRLSEATPRRPSTVSSFMSLRTPAAKSSPYPRPSANYHPRSGSGGRCGRCGRSRTAAFRRGRDTDGAGPRAAYALEHDGDADLAQEGGRAPEPAGQRPRAIRPGLGLGDALARRLGQDAQKVRGSSRPLRAQRDDGAHGGGDRVGVDHLLHPFVAVARNKPTRRCPPVKARSRRPLPKVRSRSCAAPLGVAFREGASGPPPAMPMIGFLGSMSPDLYAYVVAAAPARPQETGYIKARMYRSSIDGRRANTMAPASAVDLVGHQVAVIVGNTSAALAAKSKRRRRFQSSSAVSSIRSRLALSPALTGPRGNDVGVSSMSGEFMAKHSLSEAACTSVTRCSCEWEISLRS